MEHGTVWLLLGQYESRASRIFANLQKGFVWSENNDGRRQSDIDSSRWNRTQTMVAQRNQLCQQYSSVAHMNKLYNFFYIYIITLGVHFQLLIHFFDDGLYEKEKVEFTERINENNSNLSSFFSFDDWSSALSIDGGGAQLASPQLQYSFLLFGCIRFGRWSFPHPSHSLWLKFLLKKKKKIDFEIRQIKSLSPQ